MSKHCSGFLHCIATGYPNDVPTSAHNQDPETEIKSSVMLLLTLYMYVGESESLLIWL